MTWAELRISAPRTQALLDSAASVKPQPVLSEIPAVLGIPSIEVGSREWGVFLSTESEKGVTFREVLLRWLITRAIVDQGSDIVGVEKWHSGLINDCYGVGIRLLHDPIRALVRYEEIVEIADRQRLEVTEMRAQQWADGSPGRKVGQYTPFNVDGMRGGKQAHWFVSARMLPGLLVGFLSGGGLTQHVFGNAMSETPSEMARRLKNDAVRGLGWSMGDKACDLFAKWAIGTFRLGEGLEIPWLPEDCPLPMDQRIGRVLLRTGFMDEFFDVSRVMSIKSNGFVSTSKPLQERPVAFGPIPNGPWHLTVMNFRRNSKVKNDHLITWLNEVASESHAIKPKRWGPQDVLSMLCRSYNQSHENLVTPVELDDFLMNIATPCSDNDPVCVDCLLTEVCQANNEPTMSSLKKYFT
jgi:hypothetical protein